MTTERSVNVAVGGDRELREGGWIRFEKGGIGNIGNTS